MVSKQKKSIYEFLFFYKKRKIIIIFHILIKTLNFKEVKEHIINKIFIMFLFFFFHSNFLINFNK